MAETTASWPATKNLRNHWHWRPEWGPGRVCVYWYLTFGQGLADVLDPSGLAAVQRADWLDAVPSRWLHVTLCDVGFTDELGSADIESVLTAGGASLKEASRLNLSFGSATPMADAIVLPVGPLEPLRELQHGLRSATRRTLGPSHRLAHGHRFWPHLTLGYVNRRTSAPKAAELLASIGPASGSVTIDSLMLVAVDRDQRHYRWKVLEELPLSRRTPVRV
jgi:2'-5' RNA ligase